MRMNPLPHTAQNSPVYPNPVMSPQINGDRPSPNLQNVVHSVMDVMQSNGPLPAPAERAIRQVLDGLFQLSSFLAASSAATPETPLLPPLILNLRPAFRPSLQQHVADAQVLPSTICTLLEESTSPSSDLGPSIDSASPLPAPTEDQQLKGADRCAFVQKLLKEVPASHTLKKGQTVVWLIDEATRRGKMIGVSPASLLKHVGRPLANCECNKAWIQIHPPKIRKQTEAEQKESEVHEPAQKKSEDSIWEGLELFPLPKTMPVSQMHSDFFSEISPSSQF